MSLYKEFSTLFPYLQSVRKIENYLSFDISFPNTWKLPKKYVDENRIMEQQSNIQNERLFSYVSEITESEIERVYQNLCGIIKYNKEREEKDKLFESKVEELKKLFGFAAVFSCGLLTTLHSFWFCAFPTILVKFFNTSGAMTEPK